jgi:RNA polymerase primary sigma factor
MTNGNNILDLINEGNIGLLEAIKRFDYTDTSRGNNFVTYAVYWIRKYMQNYLITKDKIVRPANYHKLFNLVSKIKNDFYVKNERQPTLEEVSSIIRERYHLNVENLDELETIIPMSIDENGEDDNMNTTNVEHTEKYNSRTSSNNIESHYDDIEKTNTINLVLRRLDPREQTIIRRMYGIDNDGVCSTMESIAKDLCLSKERVRQLYTKSLEKMKHIGKQYINGEL